jgi:AraC-like DNA-binding protein
MIGRNFHTTLHRYRTFESGRREDIASTLVSRYGAKRLDIVDAERLHGVGALVRADAIDIGYLQFSGRVDVTFPATGFFRQQFAFGGHGTTGFGGKVVEIDRERTCVVPDDAEATYGFGQDLSQLVMRVAASALTSKLEALTGRPVNRKLAFAPSDTFKTPKQLRLRRLVSAFVSEIDHGMEPTDLVCAEYVDLLVVAFLTAHEHNCSALLEARPVSAAPWQVRLVEDYLAANWDKPLTAESVAQATGVGLRSMFLTFQKARGYTPMAFLQRYRLERARDLLAAPQPSTTVTAISLMCGFNNLGHFARYYRETFGELPSVTLGRAKGVGR